MPEETLVLFPRGSRRPWGEVWGQQSQEYGIWSHTILPFSWGWGAGLLVEEAQPHVKQGSRNPTQEQAALYRTH